jgi:hypothetical protein
MKTLVVLVVVALGGCASKKAEEKAAPAPGSGPGSAASSGSAASPHTNPPVALLTITSAPPKVGDVRTETEAQDMKLAVATDTGKSVDVTRRKRTVMQQKVLAVDGRAITKLAVTYSAYEEAMTKAGRPQPKLGVVYLVTREGDQIKVVYEDGTAPPAEEAKEVASNNRKVGRSGDLEEIIASKSWTIGTKVDLTADELARLNQARGSAGGAEELAVTALALTLKASDGRAATFDMVMRTSMKTGKGSMNVDLTGTVSLDVATGRPLTVDGTGPASGDMGGAITGTMGISIQYTY